MNVDVLIIGDTHSLSFDSLPKKMLQLIEKADWVIHVGDYTSISVLTGLIKLKGSRFKGVYGNADPLSIREQTSGKEIIKIAKKKIGITHPANGGSYEIVKAKVLNEFKNYDLDAIVYGHTHDYNIEILDEVFLINPGKGYLEKDYYGSPTSVAILKIGKNITGRIEIIED